MEINKISIPKGWRKIPIGECVVEKKKSPIKVDDAANFGRYPFFTSGEAVLQHDCKLIDGENLYLATGGMANIKYFNGEAAYSTDTYVLGTKDNICPKFMYYVLLFLKQYIDINYFQGSGLKHLQKKDFKRHEIIIPESKDEQQRIADALSKLDDSLSQTQSLIDKYELIKRGLMQDLLTFGIDNEGNVRSEKTHKFKDSPLGRIPEEWKWVILKNLEQYGCRIQTGPFGTLLHTYDYCDDGIPVIMPKDIQNNKIIDKDLLFVGEKKAYELNRFRAHEGDLLVARKGDVSKLALVDKKHDDVLCGSDCILIKMPKNISSSFFFFYYQSFGFIKEVVSQSVGTTLPTLKPSILKELHIPIMSMQEDNYISKVITQTNDAISEEYNILKKLNAQKQGLLSDLITGKVRI